MTAAEFVARVTANPHAYTVLVTDKHGSGAVQFHTLDADRAFAELPQDGRVVRTAGASIEAPYRTGSECSVIVQARRLT